MQEQKTAKKNIFVTGVGGPAGINIARLLKERDDVHVIGCDIDELAAGRLFVDEFLLCPRVSDATSYEAWLRTTISEKQIDLFIPTVDEELLPLSLFADELPCNVVISPTETLRIAADKLFTYEFVQQKLPALCPDLCTLQDWTPDWRPDRSLFLKPRHGRGARGCRVVDQTELAWLKEHHPEPETLLVMEELPGTEWTVDAYIAQNGEVVYLVPRERIGLSGGISVKGKTVVHPEVIEATKQLLQQLSCRGPVCIQWKADVTGKPKFVEINPRLSGGLMITVSAGVDPVAPLLAKLTDQSPKSQSWEEVTVVGHFEYHKIDQ